MSGGFWFKKRDVFDPSTSDSPFLEEPDVQSQFIQSLRLRVEAHHAVRKVLMHGRVQRILKKNDAYKHTTVRVGDWVKFFRSSDKKSVSQRWFGPAEVTKITDGSAFLFSKDACFKFL